jgi:cohesin loading factor subunit SCC2
MWCFHFTASGDASNGPIRLDHPSNGTQRILDAAAGVARLLAGYSSGKYHACSAHAQPNIDKHGLTGYLSQTEESRIESGEAKKKMDSQRNITVSKKISGDQDADATLFGGVLISHAPRLLQMTQVSDKKLRFAALDLVGHLLRQGQINPNESVPYLLALQGDVEEDGIRALALKLLMIEGEKRPDMLRQRVYAGIKQAYAFQKTAYPTKEHVSALVRINNGGTTSTECVFGRVFKECIASIRKQRRGLFSSLLRRFDLQNRKKTNGMNDSRSVEDKFIEDLPLLSFTAQVLAYLPYRLASDPLFIIYSINSALALRGPDLLDRLASFLRPYGLSSTDEMDESNYDEDSLEIAAKREIPHHAKEATRMLESDFDARAFSSLCAEAAAQTLLLRLKNFLRTAYDFSESRIFGFNPDAKDEKEKAFSKASQLAFYSELSMEAADGGDDMKEIDCMIIQYAEFRRLMRAEATLDNSPMYEEDDDDDDDIDETGPSRKRRRSTASATEVEEEVMSP